MKRNIKPARIKPVSCVSCDNFWSNNIIGIQTPIRETRFYHGNAEKKFSTLSQIYRPSGGPRGPPRRRRTEPSRRGEDDGPEGGAGGALRRGRSKPGACLPSGSLTSERSTIRTSFTASVRAPRRPATLGDLRMGPLPRLNRKRARRRAKTAVDVRSVQHPEKFRTRRAPSISWSSGAFHGVHGSWINPARASRVAGGPSLGF
jgi:hypothetical protein